VDDQELQPGTGGKRTTIAIGLVVVAVIAIAYVVWVSRSKPTPEAPVAQPQAKSEPVAPKREPKVEEAKPEESAPARPRAKKEKPAPPPATPVEPAGPTLVVESDVPGASVFVDRQYLGTTPVKTTGVKPGSHQLNASADGQDGVALTIDVGETGETTINVLFKEVRLDVSVGVVHKHGVGKCEGRLVGTPAGIRYETPNTNDAFTIAFKDLETFEIDYLKKELKIKKRGGKTWNFTDRTENADRLFTFHRDVTKAREKLAAQGK
jgi:hypothetical protein